MKKRKKKIFKIIILFIILYLICHFFINNKNNILQNIFKNKKYSTIALIKNNNYPGLGQLPIEKQDGYNSCFTTISENKKVYKEYKQNGNSSWSKNEYWGGTMEDNGCRNNCYFNNLKWI